MRGLAIAALALLAAGCGSAPRVWGDPISEPDRAQAERVEPVTQAAGDRDADGVSDADDACPDDPEDLDGRYDGDGCFDPDDDGDGLADAADLCPTEAEDRDGWEDEDGCPDADDDRDRIADLDDHCPREPEAYNGLDDDDGCPDTGGVHVWSCPIGPPSPVLYFAKDTARLLDGADAALALVAVLLADRPELALELHGHADPHEPSPLELSERRAELVRAELVARGVDASRLVVIPHGDAEPAAAGRTPAERALNRRVDLRLPAAP